MSLRGIVLMAIFALAGALPASAATEMEKKDLFTAGEGGYALYRIPGIIVTSKGTVLAYCEARKNGGDWDQIDVMLRRSTDGGKTWEPQRKITEPPKDAQRNPMAVAKKLGRDGLITTNNPVMFADKSGTVHFLYCVEYGRCFYTRSDDDGKTFAEPTEITATFEKFRPEYDPKIIATGPGHGTQLCSGRLIVPVWLSSGTGGNAHHPSAVSTLYSDDGGKTWNRGQIAANNPEPLADPNETCLVELSDGRVMLNMRHESKTKQRAVTISPDGAKEWSKPTFDMGLPEPVCFASLVRFDFPASGTSGKGRILFSNPDNPTGRERKNVTVRMSEDDAQTWPIKRTIEPGVSGYSDIAVAKDGTIYCLFERGSGDKSPFRTKYLTVARFNEEWLKATPAETGK